MLIAWVSIAVVLFIFGLASMKVWDGEVEGDVVPGWLIMSALWPITLACLAVGGAGFGLFKCAVWLLKVVKEAHEQCSSQREG